MGKFAAILASRHTGKPPQRAWAQGSPRSSARQGTLSTLSTLAPQLAPPYSTEAARARHEAPQTPAQQARPRARVMVLAALAAALLLPLPILAFGLGRWHAAGTPPLQAPVSLAQRRDSSRSTDPWMPPLDGEDPPAWIPPPGRVSTATQSELPAPPHPKPELHAGAPNPPPVADYPQPGPPQGPNRGSAGQPESLPRDDDSPWERAALTRVLLLRGRVVRAVHLEEQLLLLVGLPCAAAPLLQRLHLRLPRDPAAALALVLPWSCVYSPGRTSSRGNMGYSTAPSDDDPYQEGVAYLPSEAEDAQQQALTSRSRGRKRKRKQALTSSGSSFSTQEEEEEEFGPVLAVSARAAILHVRCALPRRRHPPGSPVSLAVRFPGNLSADGVDAAWARWLEDESRQRTASLAEPNAKGGSRALPLCHPELASWSSDRERGGALPAVQYAVSSAVLGRPVDAVFSGKRLVLEALPQHEGLYLFAEGVAWERNRQRISASNLTCIYGDWWRAPALFGVQGEQKAFVCPYPPSTTFRAASTSGSRDDEITLDAATAPGGEHEPESQLVEVTLEDSKGTLPSVAFFLSSAPRPHKWRGLNLTLLCAQQQGERQPLTPPMSLTPPPLASAQAARGVEWGDEESDVPSDSEASYSQGLLGSSEEPPVEWPKRFFLCSCTMGWNVAKFLREWVAYHAWLGVEHFFIYDNNSEDNLYSVALNLSQTVPHPSHFWLPGFDIRINASAEGGFQGEESGEKRRGKFAGVTVVPWPWLKSQQAGFAHCVLLTGPLCEWVAFTDVDEFVFPKLASELKSRSQVVDAWQRRGPFLRFLLKWSQKADCPVPIGQWQMESLLVGPSGQTKHPSVGVALGYTCRVAPHGDSKVIIRPEASRMELSHWIHLFGLGHGYKNCARGASLAILYHYKFQAWEQYKSKFERRVAGGVGDWKKVYRPGQTKRSDGVVVVNGVAYPPADWAQRFCSVQDRTLAKLVRFVFAVISKSGEEVFPWQD